MKLLFNQMIQNCEVVEAKQAFFVVLVSVQVCSTVTVPEQEDKKKAMQSNTDDHVIMFGAS